MSDDSTISTRKRLLARAGGAGPIAEELLSYNEPLLTKDFAERLSVSSLPDETHVEAWSLYAEEAQSLGAVGALARRFPQLHFPIRQGISETESYRAATRRGIWPVGDKEATGLVLRGPGKIRLEIHPTIAGRIPLIVAGERADFEDLVRAFSARNEPVNVPESMGACIVTGFNNWDRIHAYRQKWEESHPSEDWSVEFERLIPRKELYEDRFIILSTGPYSGVADDDAGFEEAEWLDRSLAIRRDHECTHYFTFRLVGKMRNNLLDEVIADYVGLVRTFGSYRADLALRFFGLEAFPAYREGGRLQNYRGHPPLSTEAFDVVKTLVHETVQNLRRFDAAHPDARRGREGLARLVVSLASMTLEELAYTDLSVRLSTGGGSALAPGPDLGRADGDRDLPASRRAERERISLQVKNEKDDIETAITEFSRFGDRNHLSKKVISDMQIVLDEVLSNIVKYGWDDGLEHRIDVSIGLGDGFLELEVIDAARAFNVLEQRDPDVTRPLEEKPIGGLGVYLVKKLTDEQRYERRDGRNCLFIRKRV